MFNSFVIELNNALGNNGLEVKMSEDVFWDMEGDFDFVHIHWPEFLVKNRSEFQIEKAFNYWNSNSTIIITHHNHSPHDNAAFGVNLYRKVYPLAKGIVHLGEFSRNLLVKDLPIKGQKHCVIKHHYYDEDFDRIESSNLEIGSSVLVFGKIRIEAERFLIKSVSKYFSNYNILVPSWRRFELNRRVYFLQWLIFETKFYLEKLFSKFEIGNRNVPKAHLVEMYNKARVVLIPRLKSLNSGIITQAFLHGKVVVGSNYGNVGEMLRETGNPTFDPEDESSVINALRDGFNLVDQGMGERNRSYVLEKLSPDIIAKQHISFYNSLL